MRYFYNVRVWRYPDPDSGKTTGQYGYHDSVGVVATGVEHAFRLVKEMPVKDKYGWLTRIDSIASQGKVHVVGEDNES